MLASTIANPLSDLAAAAELGRDKNAKKVNPGRVRIPDLSGRPDEIGRLSAALRGMVQSNAVAAETFVRFGATACTDVTGFGLAGHLLEMLQASNCRAKLDLKALPLLGGVIELMQKGFFSSLHEQNKQIEQKMATYIDIKVLTIQFKRLIVNVNNY